MAIRFHPADFQKLANFSPKRLQECGGITAPTLSLIQDYACHLLGHEPSSACMVYVTGAPSSWLHFGDGVLDPDAFHVRVFTSSGEDALLYLTGGMAELKLKPSGLNPLYKDDAYYARMHVELSQRIGGLVNGQLLAWPTKLEY